MTDPLPSGEEAGVQGECSFPPAGFGTESQGLNLLAYFFTFQGSFYLDSV